MKIFEKGELKLLWPFYLEYFIASSIFLIPIFSVLYFNHLGLSFFQIGILLAVSSLTQLILEIPTGAFADIYGRKKSVLLGYFIEGICMFSLFFVKRYSLILFLFALWGIGMTFSSGSKDAWIVDSINRKNKKLVHNFFNKQQSIISLGLIISGIIGAFFVQLFSIRIIWLMAAISYVSSITLLSIFAEEIHDSKHIKVKNSYKNLINQSKKTFSYGYKHHVLFYYLSATFIFAFGIFFISSLSWTPLLKNFNFPDYAIGYVGSLLAFVSMIAPFFSKNTVKNKKERNFIIYCLTASALVTLLILFANSWLYVLAILLITELFINMRGPVSEVYFHRFIPQKLRATMGSIKSMLISMASILSFLIGGYLIDLIGPRYTFFIYTPLIIPVIWIYLKIKDKK